MTKKNDKKSVKVSVSGVKSHIQNGLFNNRTFIHRPFDFKNNFFGRSLKKNTHEINFSSKSSTILTSGFVIDDADSVEANNTKNRPPGGFLGAHAEKINRSR